MVLMTSNELSYVEDKLFLQTNLSTVLRPIVEEIYKKYKTSYELFPYLHEAKFGMMYCDMVLKNQSNEKPNYKAIMHYTKELHQTTYYMYRKQVLVYIASVLKAKKAIAE